MRGRCWAVFSGFVPDEQVMASSWTRIMGEARLPEQSYSGPLSSTALRSYTLRSRSLPTGHRCPLDAALV